MSFEFARRTFADPFYLIEQDRIENGERRWRTIGLAGNVILLVVAHTVADLEEGVELIRIISARRADRSERRRYEEEAR